MKIVGNKTSAIYFKRASNLLKDDSYILKTHLGVSGFGYLKIFFNDKYFFVSNDSNLTDDFIKNAKSTEIFCDKLLQSYRGYDVMLWPESPEHYSMELYKKNNHWNGVTILKKNKNFIELYWFASKICNNLASNFYIKNSKLLISFVQYWQSKTKNRLNLDSPLATFVDGVDFSNLDKIASTQKAERIVHDMLNYSRRHWYLCK